MQPVQISTSMTESITVASLTFPGDDVAQLGEGCALTELG